MSRAGSLVRSAVVCAIGLSACTGGAKTSSSVASSGSSTGGTAEGSSVGSSGGTSGTSGGTGATGGSGTADAGCVVGSPTGLPEGSICLFPFDCGCGLLCGSDVSGVGASLVCEYPCAVDSDCPLPGEHCQTSLGFCQGGLGGSCAESGSPNLEFYGCRDNSDCPCPLECYGDPILGAACERPCDAATSCQADEYCNVQIGSCQESCNKEGLVSVFQACQEPTDCICPLSCFGDVRRGRVCELPCKADSDCTGAGEICETDAGSCQRTSDCFGVGGGLPAFAVCVNLADCACPLSCVDDPSLRPAGTSYKYCELCDAGTCQSVTGTCQPQGDGGFQSSDATPCRASSECTCPNICTGSEDLGGLRCERVCATSADCEDPAQFCVAGQCVENYCDGQLACDLAHGLDDPPDAGDGTCLRLPPYTDYVCRVSGVATGECDPQASRSNPAEVCALDFACVASFTAVGFDCARACAVNTDCGPKGYCDMTFGFGLCQLASDGGAPMCLPGSEVNDGGVCQFGECTAAVDAGDFESSDDIPCGLEDPCLCPEECLLSVSKEYFVCEHGCRTDSDCDDPGQTCSAGQCVDNDCSGTALLCDLDGKSSDGGQGTCLPADYASGTLACTAPGTATGVCSQGSSRSQSAERCLQGFACLGVLDGGLECLAACVASGDCGQGQTCVPSTQLGVSICFSLDDAGTCALGQSSPPASDACGNPGDAACGCSYGCVSNQCEQICQQDSDCLDPSDVCVGTVAQSYCVPGGD